MDFRVLPWVCLIELHNLVSSLEYLVSNRRQVLPRGIRLDSSTTIGRCCDREATRHGGLGAYLSPSVLVMDQFAVCSHVMLNACLALSLPEKSFQK